MEGNLTKKGKYYYVVIYQGKDEKGKPKYKWHNTKCEKESDAQKVKREILSSIDKGTYVEPTKILFSEFIKEWLDTQIKDKREMTTYEDYKGRIDKYIFPYFKDKQLQKLQPIDIERYYNYLKTNKDLSNNSIRHHHANIHSCLKYALKMGLVMRNVSEAVDIPKKTKYIANFLTIKEIEKLLSIINGTYVEIPVKISITLGLRRGEVLGLKWDDINFDSSEIYITKSRVRNRGIYYKKTKTESSRRTLCVPEYLMKYLKQLYLKQEQQKKWVFGDSYNNEGYICCKEDGSPLGINYINEVFRNILEKNKLPKIRFHDLRHSNASYLLKQGVNMKELQEWLGHSSMTTTSDIYSHIDAESKRDTAKKANNMFKNVL